MYIFVYSVLRCVFTNPSDIHYFDVCTCHYRSWKDFVNSNTLPINEYVAPVSGLYLGDHTSYEIFKSPDKCIRTDCLLLRRKLQNVISIFRHFISDEFIDYNRQFALMANEVNRTNQFNEQIDQSSRDYSEANDNNVKINVSTRKNNWEIILDIVKYIYININRNSNCTSLLINFHTLTFFTSKLEELLLMSFDQSYRLNNAIRGM